jgi:hypothetical protein
MKYPEPGQKFQLFSGPSQELVLMLLCVFQGSRDLDHFSGGVRLGVVSALCADSFEPQARRYSK